MTAGRPPKPGNLHVLHGTRSALGARPNEAEPTLLTAAQAAEPPAHLGEASKAVWREIAPSLQRVRLLTELDLAQLELLCDALADYRRARAQRGDDFVSYGAKGGQMLSQYAVAANMFRKAAEEGMSRFGMNPSARTRALTGQAQGDLFGADDAKQQAAGPLRHFK